MLLVLAGIAVLTALVFAAWRYGGSTSRSTPGLDTQQKKTHAALPRRLVLRGVGRGTYVEVRRDKATGKVDLQGTVGAGRPTGSREAASTSSCVAAGLRVTLNGRAVALPNVHNLRVLVTPQRTTRLHG